MDCWLHGGPAPHHIPWRWARGASQKEKLVDVETMDEGLSQRAKPGARPEPSPPTRQRACPVLTCPPAVSVVTVCLRSSLSFSEGRFLLWSSYHCHTICIVCVCTRGGGGGRGEREREEEHEYLPWLHRFLSFSFIGHWIKRRHIRT